MTLKLEVGKSYRRADGAKCTVDFDDESDFARFRGTSENELYVIWYHPDGRSCADERYNLIAEWEEPLHHGQARLPCGKVVDLTNPHGTTFGLLDEVYGKGTQEAMKKHGGPYEVFLHEGRWRRSSNPRWFDGSTYRVAPKREPKTWWIVGGWQAWDNEHEARANADGKSVVKVVEVQQMTHPIEQAADAVERELADLRDKLAALRAERDTVLGMYMRSSEEGFRQKARADAAEAALAASEAKLAVAADDAEKWKRAFSAQSSKLQAVLDIPGVRETLAQIKGDE